MTIDISMLQLLDTEEEAAGLVRCDITCKVSCASISCSSTCFGVTCGHTCTSSCGVTVLPA